jgi:hypothetical protein
VVGQLPSGRPLGATGQHYGVSGDVSRRMAFVVILTKKQPVFAARFALQYIRKRRDVSHIRTRLAEVRKRIRPNLDKNPVDRGGPLVAKGISW